ncbi:MAG TPA: hypothetical protein PKY30_01325 [Myxococcota bacterium]|nr:hypothetical protein [Myxococcota bacterium]
MAGSTKLGGQLFPRKRYTGDTSPRVFSPPDRSKVARLFGQGYRLHLHVRIYDLSANDPEVSINFLHGCFGEELPSDALRFFPLTPTTTSPSMPYVTAPDDGYIVVELGMGMVDVGLQVSGTGPCWGEVEVWYTLELEK